MKYNYKMGCNKKAQVWVETVTYTLIALVLIGATLAFVKPKLEEMKDKSTLDQTLEMMENLNSYIVDTGNGAAGNKRTPEFTLKNGYLTILTKDYTDSIIFTLEKSSSEYTEPGKLVRVGNIIVNTTDRGKYDIVQFTLNYSTKYDFQTEKSLVEILTVPKSSTTQKLSFTNVGINGYTRIPGIAPEPPPFDACAPGLPCIKNREYERGYCDSGLCKYEDIRPKLIVELN